MAKFVRKITTTKLIGRLLLTHFQLGNWIGIYTTFIALYGIF